MFQPQPTPLAFLSYGEHLGPNFIDLNRAQIPPHQQLHQPPRPPPPQSQLHPAVRGVATANRLVYPSANPATVPPDPYATAVAAATAAAHLPPHPLPLPLPYDLGDLGSLIKMEGLPDEVDHVFSDEDRAAQEAAAREYQPQFDGPLVGDKESSFAIVEEYARASPIYVEKTAALPQTYSHYRKVQGDGNCGWRAIGFCYFETLITCCTQVQIEAEVTRMLSYNQILITHGGFELHLFEDMVEETVGLLKQLATLSASPQAGLDLLQQTFNDRAASSAIIYHLRLLASASLNLDADTYEPFIPDETAGVQGYRHSTIEPVDREIEAVGIMLLFDILLKPAGFVLEIAYLDLSPGPQVQVYRYPEEASGQDTSVLGPMITLLFRPDHYDILYRHPSPPPLPPLARMAEMSNLQVNQVSTFDPHDLFSHPLPLDSSSPLHAFSTLDWSSLMGIPGMTLSNPVDMASPPPAPSIMAASAIDEDAYPSPPCVPPCASFHQLHAGDEGGGAGGEELARRISALPQRPVGQEPGPFRYGAKMWELGRSPLQPEFTTSIFKNSPHNRAHYASPEFQPEEWCPEQESADRNSAKKKGKQRVDF